MSAIETLQNDAFRFEFFSTHDEPSTFDGRLKNHSVPRGTDWVNAVLSL